MLCICIHVQRACPSLNCRYELAAHNAAYIIDHYPEEVAAVFTQPGARGTGTGTGAGTGSVALSQEGLSAAGNASLGYYTMSADQNHIPSIVKVSSLPVPISMCIMHSPRVFVVVQALPCNPSDLMCSVRLATHTAAQVADMHYDMDRINESMRLYRKAADQGDAQALYNLGWAHQSNNGLPLDLPMVRLSCTWMLACDLPSPVCMPYAPHQFDRGARSDAVFVCPSTPHATPGQTVLRPGI